MSKRKAASIGGPSHAKKGKRLGASEETRDNNSEAPVLVDDSEPFEGFGDDQPTPIATPQLDNINDGLSSMPVDEKPNYRSHSFALEVEAHDDSHHLGPSDSGDDEVSLSDNDGEEGGSEDEELSDDEVVDDNEEIEEVDGGAESQEAEGEDDEEEDDDDEFYQYPEDYGETSSYGQAWKERPRDEKAADTILYFWHDSADKILQGKKPEDDLRPQDQDVAKKWEVVDFDQWGINWKEAMAQLARRVDAPGARSLLEEAIAKRKRHFRGGDFKTCVRLRDIELAVTLAANEYPARSMPEPPSGLKTVSIWPKNVRIRGA